MQKGEFYKALDDFRVCFAGAANGVYTKKREYASAAASFFISHSLFFSLVQDILRAAAVEPVVLPHSLPQNLLCKGKSCLITSFFLKNCHWSLRASKRWKIKPLPNEKKTLHVNSSCLPHGTFSRCSRWMGKRDISESFKKVMLYY